MLCQDNYISHDKTYPAPMETTIQKITNSLTEINSRLISFLEQYSKIKRVVFPGDGIFLSGGDYSFENLPPQAIPIQDKLFKDFNTQMDIIEVLILKSPSQHKREIKENTIPIIHSILQNDMTSEKSIPHVIETINENIKNIVLVLKQLFPIENQIPILIPDTNALYFNTEIEEWTFKNIQKFTIILTPSVLRDLDKHKMEHKNENIRDKAASLINKIKEYRRRGKLIDGVVITKDKIDLISIATEPNFEFTLKWLDEKNEDDRLIAETLEIMRSYCNRPVILVTADINLQNKCDVADLIYLEPPIQ